MKNMVEVECATCGKKISVRRSEFVRQTNKNTNKKWFCCKDCFADYRMKRSSVEMICPRCHKKFTRIFSEKTIYCSRECANKSRIWSEEDRIRLSEKHRKTYLESVKEINSGIITSDVDRWRMRYCVTCGKPLFKHEGDCCSYACRKRRDINFLIALVDSKGSFPTTTHGETDRRRAKTYLIEKFGYKCSICGKTDCRLICDHVN